MVFPVLAIGVGVILSLFAMIVLLLVRRHLQFEGDVGHPIDEDRWVRCARMDSLDHLPLIETRDIVTLSRCRKI